MLKGLLIILIFCSLGLPDLYPKSKVNILFRIDDYGIDNEKFYIKLFEIFKKHNINLNVGVVPFKEREGAIYGLSEQQKEILSKGLANGNIEIAQHGYTHANNYRTNASSEFYKVEFLKQYNQIKSGKLFLENAFNIDLLSFIPPWNSYDENTVIVLEKLGFRNISAATYGNIGIKSSKINYIPYTASISEINDLIPIISEASAGKEELNYLIIILMHDYDFIVPKLNTDRIEYSTNKSSKITFDDLEVSLTKLKKNKNICYMKFSELTLSVDNLDDKRLIHNKYYKDYIPVIWLTDFRNKFYLNIQERNLNKYYRLFYQIIFYPLLFIIFTLIIDLLIRKIKYKYNKPILIEYLIIVTTIITIMTIAIVIISDIRPKYLVVITFLLSIIYSIQRNNISLQNQKLMSSS